MSNSGDTFSFSLKDGCSLQLPAASANPSILAEAGRKFASAAERISIGCDDEKLRPFLYALSAGICEAGSDVFICENTCCPSFRFGLSLAECSIGVYLSRCAGELRLSFFGKNGFPADPELISRINDSSKDNTSKITGAINQLSSLRVLYENNISDTFPDIALPINAGISCGNRGVRTLWQKFFSDSDDTLIFQVSDDGMKANAYSSELGFISHDRLITACALRLWKKGETVWLPDNFHFFADSAARRHGYQLESFSSDSPVPPQAAAQRFLSDPLFMCISLAADREAFLREISDIPKFASAKREVSAELCDDAPFGKPIIEQGGRVYISRSGKNRVCLTAQADDAETASELCAVWDEKLRRLGACNNLFH